MKWKKKRDCTCQTVCFGIYSAIPAMTLLSFSLYNIPILSFCFRPKKQIKQVKEEGKEGETLIHAIRCRIDARVWFEFPCHSPSRSFLFFPFPLPPPQTSSSHPNWWVMKMSVLFFFFLSPLNQQHTHARTHTRPNGSSGSIDWMVSTATAASPIGHHCTTTTTTVPAVGRSDPL